MPLALDVFDFTRQGRKYPFEGHALIILKENLHLFNFSDNKYVKSYLKLLDISNEYNLPAPELLYPFDIASILNRYDENFIPPRISLFNKNINKNFAIQEDQGKLIFETFGNVSLNEESLEYLEMQRITKKIRNGQSITQEERKRYNKGLKNPELGKFRKDSVIKYLFGPLAWDTAKLGKANSKANNVYIYYRYSNKYCNNTCDNFNNSNCTSQSACSKFMQEVRQSVSNSIHEKKLLGSKVNKQKINPTLDKNIVRYPLEYFECGKP